MPTTLTPVHFTHSVWFIQARTNSSNVDVDDAAGEDFRKLAAIFASGGGVTPNAFKSTATGGSMVVAVGSGTAKKDVVAVTGTSSGSPQPYMVSLDATTVNVTLAASSASNNRRDELYLVVTDKAYPTVSNALPQLVVRQGDIGTTPTPPGPDAAWRNYQKLASYYVAQNATSPIVESNTPDAALQTQITPAHASRHGIKGADPLTTLIPRNDVIPVVIAQFAPATGGVMTGSAVATVTLPTDVGAQNIRVSAVATATFDQNPAVAGNQQVYFQTVIAGDTSALQQITSTDGTGERERMLISEHTKDLDGVSAFTVQVRGRCTEALGGTFQLIVVRCWVTVPRPTGANAYVVS